MSINCQAKLGHELQVCCAICILLNSPEADERTPSFTQIGIAITRLAADLLVGKIT
jgi:hypothetical protein